MIEIRAVDEEDAKELLRIYRPYVLNTAITFEYDVPSEEEFKRRIRAVKKKYPYLAAVSDGEIIGYCYASPFKERAAYEWAVETTVYVREDKRGMGVGKMLYESLERCLCSQNILNMNACIACTSAEDEYLTNASVFFHENMGFNKVGEFHKCGYKFNRWYNMVWMEKHIGVHKQNQPEVKAFDGFLK